MLRTLLESLVKEALLPGNDTTIIVVIDNDSDESARTLVCQLANQTLGKRLVYLVEPKRGVVNARNLALAYARKQADKLIFIDDDEIAQEGWLGHLLATSDLFPEAVIAGPVRPIPVTTFPAWDPEGEFWFRPEFDHEQKITKPVGNGNVLLPKYWLENFRNYDLTFNFCGAEDTDVFLDWLALGREIRWCKPAEAVEMVPPDRLTLRWACKRAYFSSLAFTIVERKRKPKYLLWLARIGKHATQGVLFVLTLALSPKRFFAKASIHFARSFGTLMGLLKRRVNRFT